MHTGFNLPLTPCLEILRRMFCSSVDLTERKRGQGEAFNEPETPSTAQYKVPKLRLGQLIKDNLYPAGTPMYSFPLSEVTPGSF
jgi:hypothetical protein